MHELLHAWLSLRSVGCADNSQHRRNKVINTCSLARPGLPLSGRWCLGLAITLCASIIAGILVPEHESCISYVSSVLLFFLCAASFLFLRSTRKTMLTKMETGKYDHHAEIVANLLLENGVCCLQDFDAVIAWCDELIGQRQARLVRFTGGGMAVLTFCLGVFTNAVTNLSVLETLQLTIIVSLLIFGIVVADVPAAFFHIVDSVIPTSLTALQHFKADLLESKLQFMKLIQRRDKTEPVRRFYEEVVSGGALDMMGECVSEHLIVREGETSRPAGISGMRDHIESLRHTYPDLTIRVLNQYVADETVVSEVTMSGTFEHSFAGIKPDGGRVVIHAVNVDRVADGLIVEHSGAANTFETMLSRNLIRGTLDGERS